MKFNSSGIKDFKIKNPRIKKLLAFMLALSVTVSLLPMGAVKVMADLAGDFQIWGGVSKGFDWDYGAPAYPNTLIILLDGNYRIEMDSLSTTNIDHIIVDSGVTANITLADVKIDVSSIPSTPAFYIESGSTVNLILEGDNELISESYGLGVFNSILSISGSTSSSAVDTLLATSDYGEGICAYGGSVINIGGGVEITAYGGVVGGGGAGIGGGFGGGGVVNIGGNAIVEATGGSASAGIGGSSNNSLTSINITGSAIVTATGNGGGAGIGGGYQSSGGSITIGDSAQVEATGDGGGAGIGGGYQSDGGNITISGNAQVEAIGGGGFSPGDGGGAGIGGGYRSSGGSITIGGSADVEATGGDGGAGIGGGYQGAGGTINITGTPVVDAWGSADPSGVDGGSGIGGGADAGIDGNININITDGVITAAAGNTAGDSAAIGKVSWSGVLDTFTFSMPNYQYFHSTTNSGPGTPETDTTTSPLNFPNDYKYLRILRGGEVTLTPSSHPFTTVAFGYSTPAEQIFTITNNTAGTVTITGAALGGANFVISTPLTLPAILPAGTSVTLGIRPTTGLGPGSYPDTLTVTGSDSGGTHFTLTSTLTFVVDALPTYDASINPTSWTFTAASEGYGPQTPQTFTIRNTGTGNITSLTAALGTSNFVISTALAPSPTPGTPIIPGLTATVSVQPAPGLTQGTYNDILTITGNDGISRTANLSFTVTAAPVLAVIYPDPHTFTRETEGYLAPASQVFTISNIGLGSITGLTASFGGGPFSPFEVSVPLSSTTIPVAGTATITVRPRLNLPAGPYTDSLIITYGGVLPLTVDLNFTVDPPLALGLTISPPDPFAFPPAEAGYGDQAPQEFTIRNNGTANITGLAAALGKGVLSEFTIDQVLSVSALSPGALGTIRLRPVTGLAAGTYTDTLTITGDGGVTLTINLSFTVSQGFVPVTGISGVPYMAEAGTPLTLTGTVNPEGAANRTIVWSVLDPGSTGAVITNNILNASSPGVVTIRATIANGLGPGVDYTQDFMVLVTPEGYSGGENPGYPGWFFPGFPWGGYSGAYINPQLVYYEKGSSRDVSIVLYRSGFMPANLRYEGRYEDFTGGWGWGGNYAEGFGGPYGGRYAGPYDGRYAGPYDGPYDGRYAGPYDGPYDGRYAGPYDAPYGGIYDDRYAGGYSSGSYAGGSPNRGYILAEGRDYTAIRDVFTLKASFLDTLPAGGHVISFVMNGGMYPALFIAVTDPGGGASPFNPFVDVREGDWFFDAVADLYRRRVMIGVSDNRFGWDEELTRAMMVTILYRLAGEPDIGGVPNPFYDVPEGTWYTAGVKWAAENQITEGYGGGRFGPVDPITNEQLAVFISRVQESDVNKPPFILEVREWQDSEYISSWARTAVHTLSAQGIYRDIPGRNLNPGDPAPRATVASMLYRYLTAIGR